MVPQTGKHNVICYVQIGSYCLEKGWLGMITSAPSQCMNLLICGVRISGCTHHHYSRIPWRLQRLPKQFLASRVNSRRLPIIHYNKSNCKQSSAPQKPRAPLRTGWAVAGEARAPAPACGHGMPAAQHNKHAQNNAKQFKSISASNQSAGVVLEKRDMKGPCIWRWGQGGGDFSQVHSRG